MLSDRSNYRAQAGRGKSRSSLRSPGRMTHWETWRSTQNPIDKSTYSSPEVRRPKTAIDIHAGYRVNLHTGQQEDFHAGQRSDLQTERHEDLT
jgi:hypothetical protein